MTRHSAPSAAGLAAALGRLDRRVSALERRLDPTRQARPAAAPRPAPTALLDALMARRGRRYHDRGTGGALGYAGFIKVDDRRYAWTRETAVPELLGSDWGGIVGVLAGVASTPRIGLLTTLFGRDRTSAELAAALGEVSPGHAYHHIRELQAAGIVVQASRGVYRIAPHALIPVAIILAAAADIAQSRSVDDGEPFVPVRQKEVEV
jgi:hypothetical protein